MPPSSRPLRIAIVNDFEVVVSGMAAMLEPHSERVAIVELDNQLPVISDVDLVLFDTFAFVDSEGLGLPDLVRPAGAKVVVFSWTLDPASVTDALDQGAAGYLSKALSPLDLLGALEAIHAGAVVTTQPGQLMAGDGSGDWPGRVAGLSSREAEVLALIAEGLTNQVIAEAMYISINSVKTYIRIAYRKIGVQRRSQAVGWALTHGFGTDPQRTFPRR